MVKALRCGCGRRLEAGSDEGLFGRVLEHLSGEHPAVSFDEGQVRALVAHSYALEYTAPYADGSGPDEEFGPEPY